MVRAHSRRSFLAPEGPALEWHCSLPQQSSLAIDRESHAVQCDPLLRAVMRTLEVNGKTATLMGLEQTDGKQGLSLL